jgi:hypothetical protein
MTKIIVRSFTNTIPGQIFSYKFLKIIFGGWAYLNKPFVEKALLTKITERLF